MKGTLIKSGQKRTTELFSDQSWQSKPSEEEGGKKKKEIPTPHRFLPGIHKGRGGLQLGSRKYRHSLTYDRLFNKGPKLGRPQEKGPFMACICTYDHCTILAFGHLAIGSHSWLIAGSCGYVIGRGRGRAGRDLGGLQWRRRRREGRERRRRGRRGRRRGEGDYVEVGRRKRRRRGLCHSCSCHLRYVTHIKKLAQNL